LVDGINEFIIDIDTNTNKTLYFTILIQEFQHGTKKNGSQYMPTEKCAFNPKPYKSSTPNTISEEVSNVGNVGQENINAGKTRSFVWEHFTKQYMDEVSKQSAIIIPGYFLGIQNLEQVIYIAII
jgi:hypothetical protein